jgi:hypothetical protein
LVNDPDGRHYQLRLMPPGEPGSGEARFAVVSILKRVLTRGLWVHNDANRNWVAVVQRQRGPWRRFETVESKSFAVYKPAAQYLLEVRKLIKAGEYPATGQPQAGQEG